MIQEFYSNIQEYWDFQIFTKINHAKQKHLWCKKGEANQKQQLSDYGYIAILAT